MRVLVTGATGLVGCHAAARVVADGHTLRALVRDRDKLERSLEPFGVPVSAVEAVDGDILDAGAIEAAVSDCDAIIHCAGYYSHDPEQAETMRRTNVDGTRNALGIAVGAGLDPIVHVSSFLAMFPCAGERMTADSPVTEPTAAYARSKADAERVARAHQEAGAPVVTVYPASVQGPYDPTVVAGTSQTGPALIARALRSGRVLVTEGGLAYTDARDLARVLSATLKQGLGPRRYLFGGAFLSHQAYYDLLCDLTGRELRADRLPGWLLRGLGRIGDLRMRWLGANAELHSEAAWVLTRCVPLDDSAVRDELGIEPIPARESFEDLLRWMHGVGLLEDRHVGAIGRVD